MGKSKSKRRAAKLIEHLLTMDEAKRCNSQRALDNEWVKHSAQAEREKVEMSVDELSNVHKFYRQNALKKTALSVISRMLSEEEIIGLKETFDSIDGNLDGVITYSELSAAINQQFNDGDQWHETKQKKIRQKGLSTNVAEVLKMMDVDGDATITYSEFLMATLDKQQYEEESLMWSAFKKFDKDSSGKIGKNEIEQVLKDSVLKEGMTSQQIDDMIASFDGQCGDGEGTPAQDGEIDFDEFKLMMKKASTGGGANSRGGGWKAEKKREMAEEEDAAKGDCE